MPDPRDIDPRLDIARNFTDEQRRGFLRAVAQGKSRTAAARLVGVPFSAVVRAEKSDSLFRDGLADAEAEKWGLAEAGLYSALEKQEPWAIRLVVKEAVGQRERWKPAPDESVGVVEVGPGVERVAGLMAALEERKQRTRLTAGPVLEVESNEVEG